jgi:hypothetical protein
VRHASFTIVDGAFLLLLTATIVCFFVKSSHYGLSADDWRMAERGQSLGDYLQPYNNNLSIVPIAIYRALYAVVGFGTYVPLRSFGIATETGIALAMFLVARTRVGPIPALVAATALLWYPGLLIVPAAFNHYLAVIAVLACAWLLDRDSTQTDIALGLALSFALGSSGVGVAGAVGCLVYTVVGQRRRGRLLAVAVPTAAWAAWWLFVAQRSRGPQPRTTAQMFHFVIDGVNASFQGLVGGNAALGVVLTVLFAANLAWQLRRGLIAARWALAWTAALVAWWAGLSFSRGQIVRAETFRYALVGSVFVVLALLPPVQQLPRWRRIENPAAIAAGLLAAALIVGVNYRDMSRNARGLELASRAVRETLIVANLGPAVVPDNVGLSVGGFFQLPAGEYRHLVDKFGTPPGTRPEQPDVTLVRLIGIKPFLERTPLPGKCVPVGPFAVVAATSKVTLRAPTRGTVAQVRRFGRVWATTSRLPAGVPVTISLPGLQSPKPWLIRAPGACLIRGETTTITVPTAGQTVRGTAPLIAMASGNSVVTRVVFHVAGNARADFVIGEAVRSAYGWLARWDTTSVPNGDYTLNTVATDAAGNASRSASVRITVRN